MKATFGILFLLFAVVKADIRVAVTGSAFSGNLMAAAGGGHSNVLDAADSICAQEATAAGVAGEWRALLACTSCNGGNPVTLQDRLNMYTGSPNQIFRTNANGLVAFSLSDLLDGEIESRIRYRFDFSIPDDEFNRFPWTGAHPDGTPADDNCDNWTSEDISLQGVFGDSSNTTSAWLESPDWTLFNCADAGSLYCFEATVSQACSYQTCISTGDPHIRTFGGLYTDFQNQGVFDLVRSSMNQLTIQTLQGASLRSALVSVNRGLAVRYMADTFATVWNNQTLQFDAFLNGSPVPLQTGSLGTSFNLDSTGTAMSPRFVLQTVDSHVTVNFDFIIQPWNEGGDISGYINVRVGLTEAFNGMTTGLCGNKDCNSHPFDPQTPPDNIFPTPDPDFPVLPPFVPDTDPFFPDASTCCANILKMNSGVGFRSCIFDVVGFNRQAQEANPSSVFNCNKEIIDNNRYKDTQKDKSGSGVGDPHFVGFNGIKYNFDGEDGKVFNIITDIGFQLNTEFKAMEVNGVAGTWMVSAGFRIGSDLTAVFKPETGFLINENIILSQGEREVDGVTFTVISKKGLIQSVTVKSSKFIVNLTVRRYKEGTYLDLQVSIMAVPQDPHGVLGQTARSLLTSESVEDFKIEGKMEDYIVRDGLLGTKFHFNKFGKPSFSKRSQFQANFEQISASTF